MDDRGCPVGKDGQGDASLTPPTPVDLELDWVLGKMPQKVWGRGGGMCFPPASPSYWFSFASVSPMPSLPRYFYLATLLLQEFFLQREPPVLQPLVLPPDLSVRQALERVLRLPAVASKRYLTNKVLLAPHLAFCIVSCPASWPSPALGFPRLWEQRGWGV